MGPRGRRRVPRGPGQLAPRPLPGDGPTGLHRGYVRQGPDGQPLRLAPSRLPTPTRGGSRAPGSNPDPASHPLRVVAFHGTADRLNPFAGSSTERWDESVPDAAAAWARALGLPSEPTVRRSPLTSREWTSATPVGWQPSLCSSREEPATRGPVRVCRSSLPSPASSSPPYPPFSCGSPSDGPPRRSTPRPRSGRNRRVCVTGHVHPAPEEPMPTAVAPAL
jgi:hypothetical protein